MKYDEFSIGDTFYTDPVAMTKESILEFAGKYDPQYFHTDEARAKESPYGSLIASGFHTMAVVWTKWIEMDILGFDCLGGAGADMKWLAPVKPGDVLEGSFTIVDKRKVKEGNSGLLTIKIVIRNQEKQEVMVSHTKVFIKV